MLKGSKIPWAFIERNPLAFNPSLGVGDDNDSKRFN
jgi:hypothetical protein